MAYTTINKPSSYFNTILYTGDATSPRSITGVGFKPDLTWIKNRSQIGSNGFYDAVRGTGASKNLSTDSTGAQGSGGDAAGYGFLSAFNTDGISVTAGTVGSDITNKSGSNYVNWNWLASNTTVSNTSGSITSTVSANTTSGFSIVTYTGTGANASIGHGLGAVPKFIIVKCTSNTMNWPTYNANSINGVSGITFLDVTDAEANYGTSYWQTTPTSTLFYVGSNTNTNNSGYTYVAYVFADIKGFSKFGSYTGNGSVDGPFAYTGFKPAWILMKDATSASQWRIWDNKRETYNTEISVIRPNSNAAEQSNAAFAVDFLSNGFKIRYDYAEMNASGEKYLYMAFAENPFVSSTQVPTTAR
jgi:hypothetical protein